MQVEYRVVPVTRFAVTRFHRGEYSGGVDSKGEFNNENAAYEVAYALAETERQALGYALDDPRMKYPDLPKQPEPIKPGPIGSGGLSNPKPAA